MNEGQNIEDLSVKSDQLISLLMILGCCNEEIENEEMKSAIFLARNLAQEIDSFLEKIRTGNYDIKKTQHM